MTAFPLRPSLALGSMALFIAGCSASGTSSLASEPDALAFPPNTSVVPVTPGGTDTAVRTAAGTDTTVAPTSGKAPVEDRDLFDMLLQNGALTSSQHQALINQENADVADGPTVSVGPRGFRVKSADGESSIRIGGRIQTDANFHENEGSLDAAINDGTELRRGRFLIQGTLPEDILYVTEVDFGNNGTSVKDFWVGRDTENGPKVMFGHQKQPFSLDVEMSSNDMPFVERGVDNFLIVPFVDRAIGLRVEDNTDSTFYAAGVYGAGISPTALDDEGWGLTGRFVAAPILDENRVLHLGVRGSLRMPEDGGSGVRIRDESTNMSNFRIVDTGVLTDVDSLALYGAEAVYATGPFSIGGEFNSAVLDTDGSDLDFSSWHVQATYSLTGEARAPAYRLSAGEFKRLKADNPSGRAWELAARLANIDLNDGALSGGEQDAFSLGLNWYYSENLRFMLNYTNVLDTSGGLFPAGEAEGLDIVTFRVQLNF